MENKTVDLPLLPYTLRAIYLRNSNTFMAPGFDPTIPNQPLIAFFRTMDGTVDCRETTFEQDGVKSTLKSCTFTARFDFAYRIATTEEIDQSDDALEKTTVARISAEISADYLMNADQFPPEEDLQKWGQSNAMLHTWPYWREFCHSTMLRMSLPATIIPLANFLSKPTLD